MDLAWTGDGKSGGGGLGSGQAMLEHLEANHLFILPLDDERRWYRYHRLFADLLRARLPILGPRLGCPSTEESHRRASAWYEAEGLRDEAIGHALAAGGDQRAADLVSGAGLDLLVRGELTTLLGWLGNLSDVVVRARPWLCVYHGCALALSGRPESAEARLQDAEMGGAGNLAPEARGHIAAVRSYLAAHAGDVSAAVELAHHARELLPEEERTVRSVVAFTLAGVHRVQGDLEAVGRALAEASLMGREGGNLHLAVSALCQWASMEMEQGRLHDAARRYRRALQLAGDLPVAASAYAGLGALHYEWDDLPAAEAHLARALELHRRWGNTDAIVADQGDMLRLRLAQGDLDGATTVLDAIADLAERSRLESPGAFVPTWVEICRVRVALARGDLAATTCWAMEREARPLKGKRRSTCASSRSLPWPGSTWPWGANNRGPVPWKRPQGCLDACGPRGERTEVGER